MAPLSRRRAVSLLAGLPPLVASALVLPPHAGGRAQAAGPGEVVDGRLVVRGDGAIYLIERGLKRPVAVLREADDEVNTLPDGEPLVYLAPLSDAPIPAAPCPPAATVAPVVAAPEPTATPPAAQRAVIPGEPGPATSLIGQRVLTRGSNDQPISVTVVDARWVDSYPSTYGTRYAAGAFALVVAEVTNNGLASSYCGIYAAQVVDERGRRHDASRLYVASATERAWGFPDGTNPRINPGLTRRSLLAFDVPPEITRLTLVPFKR